MTTTGEDPAAGVDADAGGGQSAGENRSAVAPRVVRRLETQGFACRRGDPAFAAVVPWLRWSPGLTTAVTAVGVALASPAVLGGLAVVTGGCAASTRHPFDYLYNHGVRAVAGTETLPRNGAPRRFACALATLWLVTTAAAFWAGTALVGYGLGAVLVALGGLVATTHFCFGSLVYRVVVERTLHRRVGS